MSSRLIQLKGHPSENQGWAQLALALGHAMAEVAADNAGEEWKDCAYDAYAAYARNHSSFKTEDVRNSVAGQFPSPPDLRSWGQVALRAKREGIIVHGGFVRAANAKIHGMIVSVWVSQIYVGGPSRL